MAPTMTRKEVMVIIVMSWFSALSAIAIRPFDQEVPISSLNVPGCDGSYLSDGYQNMIVENEDIYIGATNAIMHLSTNLEVRNRYRSGPRNDSIECRSPIWCPVQGDRDLCISTVRCENNYNRILLAYRNRLLACGTLYEVCEILQLNDVANTYGNQDPLQCKSENVNQFTQVSSRNLGQKVVAALSVDEETLDSDLLYLGQPGKFIQTLIAPSQESPYFTLTDTLNGGSRAVYHLAWTTETYGFVLWTNSSTSEVKLSRYCNSAVREVPRSEISLEFGSDSNAGLRTYTEITLGCSGAGLPSLNVESAKFQFDKLFIHFKAGNQSQICSATFQSINNHFNYVRRQCYFAEDGARYAKRFLRNCSQVTPTPIPEWETCAVPSIEYRFIGFELTVIGLVTFEMSPFVALDSTPSVSVSNFVIDKVNGFYVTFLGTTNGDFIKVRVNNGSSNVSERIESNSSMPILSSSVIKDGILYAISSDEILKTRVANCEQYETCSACMTSFDPYCGWCVQQSRCTEAQSCRSSASQQNWIGPSLNSSFCPRVSAITPETISVGSGLTRIDLSFSGVPLEDSLSYQCTFSTSENVQLASTMLSDYSSATMTGNCNLPDVSDAMVPADSDNEKVTLSVTYNNTSLASGQLRIYSCLNIKDLYNYTMCSSCVTSEWGCSWCASTGVCSNAPLCFNEQITSQASCPIVTGFADEVQNISAGEVATFFLKTSSSLVPVRYQCQYNFCGKSAMSPALINPSSMVVECRAVAGLLTCDKPSSAIEIYVKRGEYVIDTPSRVSVTDKLVNCSSEEVSGTCAECIAFRSECEQCVWCWSKNTCTTRKNCADGPILEIADCGAPIIDSISPTSSPFQGGTEVTILGRNLGSNVSQITRVQTGRVECVVNKDLYIPSKRIVCVTGAAASRSYSGLVTVSTDYNRTARSTQEFQFRVVTATRYNPNTVLNRSSVTITGRNLNVGNRGVVYFGNNLKNNVTCANRKENSLTCRLPPVMAVGTYSLTLKLDNYNKTFTRQTSVLPIPTLTVSKNIAAFGKAGGSISLSFTSLDGVQTVELQVGSSPSQSCNLQPLNKTVTCRISPQESETRTRRQADESPEAVVTLNGEHRLSLGPVKYYPDPVLSDLKVLPCHTSAKSRNLNGIEEKTESLTRTIQIPGKNFDLTNPAKSDYIVLLQPEKSDVRVECNVTFIEDASLFCRAWSSQLSLYVNRKINILVYIGSLNLTRNEVDYCVEDQTVIFALIIAIPIVGALFIVIVVLLLRQRRRVKRQARERTIILKKLDDLENKTREQARNAYYELQVGYMNNLSDNITRRIAYRPPELYFIQTLFHLAGEHPVLDRTALLPESPKCDPITEWTKLIKNRNFLMTFIRTLEEQKKFTIQEKGNVASLLVVSLFDDMPYFTNIMFELLTELIQKHVHKNPKLLLRRSESVVEKMVSHWLSINLYDESIMGRAGEPLFLLTKAIHYLVSSAPCDVITQKSVNSMNESTLLSTEVSYTTQLILASMQEENGNVTKPVEVSVVDVDSITQAKQKVIDEVYKDKPYSECPKPDDLEFELHPSNGSGEGVILSDIDGTSEKHRTYTKVNTLKHYNVDDKSRVVLRHLRNSRPASPDPTEPLLNDNGKTNHIYHLIHPRDDEISNGYGDVDNGGEKRADALLEGMINRPFQEIYLTRMVRSKTTLQEYVDGVFKSILCPDPIPEPIRYFFQFLDREAIRHGITDNEVVHIWKTNSLLLRYWVNILKNPEFLFDVNKTPIIDSCLSVITQAFMDACAMSSRKLGQDSPSNKLLYAKDLERYKAMVNDFFKQVSNTSWIRDEDIDETLKKISQLYAYKFNSRVACQQLYQYLFKYKDQVICAIRRDDDEDLAQQVEKIAHVMEGKQNISTTMV